MKVAFSTLGCPSWTWSEIISTAKDFGYQGIEVRGVKSEIFAPAIKEFSDNEIEKTMKKLTDLGLSIPCFTTGSIMGKENAVSEGKAYIDLAEKMGTPYIRVLGDSEPAPGDNIDDTAVIKGLKELCEYAKTKGVTCLIETNGVYSKSDRLLNLINSVSSSALGVLWDIHHTYRYGNEELSETFDKLGKYILHVHIKDSKMVDGKASYKMMGEGDIPVEECISILEKNNFDGFVSLEWVKRWYDDLEEPGIVFMQFINYLRNL